MKTLRAYLAQVGWDTTELSRQAGINYATAKKAVDGEPISPRIAREIAAALSRATGTLVQVGDISGLTVK